VSCVLELEFTSGGLFLRESGRRIAGPLLDAGPSAPSASSAETANRAAPLQTRRVLDAPAALEHPVVLVDPRPLTLFAIGSLRRHRIPIHVFSESLLDPSLYARGVSRHRLPSMRTQPRRWQARLLELAALIEPRPVLIPCSKRARTLLHDGQVALRPHFEIAHLETLDLRGYETQDFRTERALRRTIVRGEPAFEVQVTLDSGARCNAACVLTWVAGVPPNLVVTSVEGHEILERSLEWLRSRRVRGYARLIWAPDRFGRVDLQAVGTLPGSGWMLALDDGVDFPLMWYACLAGVDLPAQFARRALSCQVSVATADADDASAPLIAAPTPTWREEPLARLATFLGSMRG
jgi:hypothetical protein